MINLVTIAKVTIKNKYVIYTVIEDMFKQTLAKTFDKLAPRNQMQLEYYFGRDIGQLYNEVVKGL